MTMKNAPFILLLLLPGWAFCQSDGSSRFSIVVVNEHRQAITGATVKLLKNGKVVSSAVAGEDGQAMFAHLAKGVYRFLISSTGYQPKTTEEYRLPGGGSDTV